MFGYIGVFLDCIGAIPKFAHYNIKCHRVISNSAEIASNLHLFWELPIPTQNGTGNLASVVSIAIVCCSLCVLGLWGSILQVEQVCFTLEEARPRCPRRNPLQLGNQHGRTHCSTDSLLRRCWQRCHWALSQNLQVEHESEVLGSSKALILAKGSTINKSNSNTSDASYAMIGMCVLMATLDESSWLCGGLSAPYPSPD